MSLNHISYARWKEIIPVGYVGQESLMPVQDVVGDISDWKNAETCFDLGCGRGAFAIHLCELFPKLHMRGVDICSESLEHARNLACAGNLSTRLTFCLYDIDKIHGIDYSKFDSIISIDAIQHSRKPTEILRLLIDRWSRVGPLRVSSWYFSNNHEGIDIAMKWGFYSPVSFNDYRNNAIDMDENLVVTDSGSKFLSYIEASLHSLVKLEDDLRHLFDNKIIDDRLSLEECTVTAARKGNIGQIVINNNSNIAQ